MYEIIKEYTNYGSINLKIDKEKGVIHDVKILGMKSSNNREYPLSTLRDAVPLYENARVNLDHPEGDPRKPRSYQDRLGVIRDVKLMDGDGLYANFHFNPMHPLAEQLIWDAEHFPGNVGFSHNVEALTSRNNERVVVDKIIAVRSVDLVADPATTSGLFESLDTTTSRSDATLNTNITDPITDSKFKIQETNADATKYKRQAVLLRRLCEAFAVQFTDNDNRVGNVFHKTFLDHLCSNIDEDTGDALIRDRMNLVREAKIYCIENTPVSKSRSLFESDRESTNDTASFVTMITY